MRQLIKLGLLLSTFGMASALHAQVISPRPWTDFDATIKPHKINGVIARDVEGAGDASIGVGNTPDLIDIASGDNLANANCWPTSATGGCGTSPSTYLGLWDNGTSTGADDYVFFRLRIADDPRGGSGGGSAVGFGAYHWNILIDSDVDGYKEFWIDLFGGFNNTSDALRLFYENNATQEITNDVDPLIAWLDACNTASATCGGTGRPSFTRAVLDTSTNPDEWFVDVQVPLILLDDASGVSDNPNRAGTTYTAGSQVIDPGEPIQFIFSTSASNTDPLQKDYSAPCTSPPLGTCQFGQPATTPVSLTHVTAKRTGGATVLNFSTAIEAAHSGFFIETLQNGEWKSVRFVPGSEGPTPLQRRDYQVTLKGNLGNEYRLVELDAQGGKRVHGPFQVGRGYGDSRATAYRGIDWKSAAMEWRATESALNKSRAAALSSKAATPGISRPLAEIDVSEPGVVRVRASELRTLGVAVDSIDSGDYALVRGSESVPLYTSRAGGTLADSDYIEFVADFSPTLYTRTAVYQLRADKARSARVFTRNANVPAAGREPVFYQAKRTFENNRTYSFSAPTADPFYDARILAYGQPANYATQINLDRFYPQAESTRVRMTLWGGADFDAPLDHHAVVSINGKQVADQRFDGTEAAIIDAELDARTANQGALSLNIALPFDNGQIFDLVNYDKIEVTYPRFLFADRGALDFELDADIVTVRDAGSTDVSAYAFDQGKVTRLRTTSTCLSLPFAMCTAKFAGLPGQTRYVIGSATAMVAKRTLRAAPADANLFAGDAQLLIISHAQFRAAATRLADARRAEGLSADVVDVADVYRQFGNGSPDPAAIRNYLGEAKQRRGTAYVVLFGGDTYDYHNNLGYATISHIPSSYVAYDKISRFVPSDSDVADIDRDHAPDLAIGRLPARTAAEANAMVDKILAHDRLPAYDRVTMVADRGAFAAKSTAMASLIPTGTAVETLHLDESSIPALRSALMAKFAAGLDVVNYFGHSSPTLWSFESILTSGDIANIVTPRPFVASQLGCWNTYYVDPRFDNISRAMLAAPNAAAAAIGPTGLADDGAEEAFAQHYFPRLHSGSARIGDAILAAKQAMRAQGDLPLDIQLGVNLLGDPSMRLH